MNPETRVAEIPQSKHRKQANGSMLNLQACSHYASTSTAYDPQRFIRYPYRPSILTLLRRVRTTPRDPIVKPSKRRIPNVLASFQWNWDKQMPVPILTLAAGCDTAVHSPTFERTSFRYGIVTVEATRESERQTVQFEVPLIFHSDFDKKTMVLDYYKGFNLGDRLNSYVIHPNDLKNPVLQVNLWNLTNAACHQLHVTSLTQIDTHNVSGEHYLLGMTGVRDTTFQIEYPTLTSKETFFLDHQDLVSIGYFVNWNVQARFEKKEDRITPRAHIALLFPMPDTKCDKNIVTVSRQRYEFSIKEVWSPNFYPPRQTPSEGIVDCIHPEAFPPGYFPQRECLDRTVRTVQDAIDGFANLYPKPPNATEAFAEYYSVPIVKVYNNVTMNFKDFLKYCDLTQVSHLKGTPKYYKERAGVWTVPSRHPALRYHNRLVKDIEIDYLVNIFDSDDEEQMTAEATSTTTTTTTQTEILQPTDYTKQTEAEPEPSPKMAKHDAVVSPESDKLQSGNTATLCDKTGLLYWMMNDE